MIVKRKRDLSIIEQDYSCLVIACDSCGSIGDKKFDEITLDPMIVAYFTVRVAVFEVLSVGAEIITICDTLPVEMYPTGKRMIEGIKLFMKEAEVGSERLNGTTEDTFKTVQSGIGVTVIGTVEKDKMKLGCSKKNDSIYVIGKPKTGNEIKFDDEEICSVEQLMQLVELEEVHDIIPVGSKGILYEANQIAELNGLKFELTNSNCDFLSETGGPATSVVFSGNIGNSKIKDKYLKIGRLHEMEAK